MRTIQALFFAALLVVLTFIAIDLHRIAVSLSPQSPTLEALFGTDGPPNETRAERNERLGKHAAEAVKDMDAVFRGATRRVPEKERPADARPH